MRWPLPSLLAIIVFARAISLSKHAFPCPTAYDALSFHTLPMMLCPTSHFPGPDGERYPENIIMTISPPILVVSDPFERCNKNKSPDGRFWSSRAASTLRFVHPAIQKAPTSCTGEDPTRYAPESSNFHSRLLHGRKIGSSETSGAYNRLDVWHDGWRSCIFLQLDVE